MRKIFTAFIMMLCAICVASAANYLTFTAEEAGSTFRIYNSEDNDPDVQYSLDNGETWTVLKEGERVTLQNVGDKALLKGNNDMFCFAYKGGYDYSTFVMTGKIAASGSVMSLLDGEGSYKRITVPGCFYQLFASCTSLTQAPELPATDLADQCYQMMFYNCTSLREAPELPATKLYPGCYAAMFYGCTSLKETPYLPATKFFDEYGGDDSKFLGCYASMFGKCTSLEKVRVNFSDWGDSYLLRDDVYDTNTEGWFYDVKTTGTFICPRSLPLEYGESRIPKGWAVKYIEDEGANYLTFTAQEAGSTFGISNFGENNPNILYSLNEGMSWEELKAGESVSLVNVGDKAILRGTNFNGISKSTDVYTKFTMTGKIAASGSVMSLVDDKGKSTVIPSEYCFCKLFSECASLTQAPELPAVTLSSGAYYYMFSNCTGLSQAPKLPATDLDDACYRGLFSGCENLTKAPELLATTMASSCYSEMFKGCVSLAQAPELPATTLAEFCYYSMFENCSKLLQAPELPAMTMYKSCYYYMFQGCSKLTQAPKLPATTLADHCYRRMFALCPGLTRAPELSATTLADHCYCEMFYRSENLSEIKVNFEQWSDATSAWTAMVASTGTFICPKALAEEYGVNRIPEGWTVKYIEEGTGVGATLADNLTVWTDGLTVFVRGAEGEVSLYDMSGRSVAVSNSADEERALSVPSKGVYVVRTSGGERSVLVR
ncbi:MAG: T9SS type A sorting domain-containing protein [Paludibacteraceae bacterium]|nr:T9SS type A sorting domain-containing protein [Paludibacteraceae bacterium]